MSDNEHAIGNARAWVGIIIAAMTAIDALDDGARPVTFEGDEFDCQDALRDRLQEMPLSLQVRDGWRTPGAESDGAEEFEILLSTGGPALRIFGKIDGDYDLQWQDWGTPWTDYNCTDQEREALSSFVGLFYLGE